jgi:hypothetical protein
METRSSYYRGDVFKVTEASLQKLGGSILRKKDLDCSHFTENFGTCCINFNIRRPLFLKSLKGNFVVVVEWK